MKTAMERGDTIGCGITGFAEKKQETLLRRKKRQNGEGGIYKEKADARVKKKKKERKKGSIAVIFSVKDDGTERREIRSAGRLIKITRKYSYAVFFSN